jgi:NADH-quinone oxidoreductase subunit B
MGVEYQLPSVVTTKLSKALNWARKYSLFQYPFVTACCGMEYMATAASRYDIARFGAEIPRFSPRHADLLFVVGTVNHKLAPFLRTVYEQMAEPKWVISFGVCASTGGFYDNYTAVQGIDKIIPVDIYIPGCPPRPEQVLDALMLLQEKIESEPFEKYNFKARLEDKHRSLQQAANSRAAARAAAVSRA